ncbi:NBS-LRR type resistance protein [Cucumis melo var. makuwa]|uniref:NBS-LRR type resistance protein n=1 Tax=Cucumis melo var. makuwa TaxID=1194695 RepID=A0A5A7UCG8_CUCMM|nr:NBS-LRR type resistance protein [Cucumis melo var. makuwa]
MSSLKEEDNRSIVWNCFGKHTFELGHSCRRPPRMRIIKCWNSNPSLPQRVVSHSLRMRYAIRCWVDDQATQKALVGDPSRRPAERQVQAVRRHLVRSPQKKEIELQAKLHEALERIEVQDRNHQALASQVEAMKKMIEKLTRAQQGPPHDP